MLLFVSSNRTRHIANLLSHQTYRINYPLPPTEKGGGCILHWALVVSNVGLKTY